MSFKIGQEKLFKLKCKEKQEFKQTNRTPEETTTNNDQKSRTKCPRAVGQFQNTFQCGAWSLEVEVEQAGGTSEGLTAKNVPNSQQAPNHRPRKRGGHQTEQMPAKSTPGHITFKLQKTKDNEKILKAA